MVLPNAQKQLKTKYSLVFWTQPYWLQKSGSLCRSLGLSVSDYIRPVIDLFMPELALTVLSTFRFFPREMWLGCLRAWSGRPTRPPGSPLPTPARSAQIPAMKKDEISRENPNIYSGSPNPKTNSKTRYLPTYYEFLAIQIVYDKKRWQKSTKT